MYNRIRACAKICTQIFGNYLSDFARLPEVSSEFLKILLEIHEALQTGEIHSCIVKKTFKRYGSEARSKRNKAASSLPKHFHFLFLLRSI